MTDRGFTSSAGQQDCTDVSRNDVLYIVRQPVNKASFRSGSKLLKAQSKQQCMLHRSAKQIVLTQKLMLSVMAMKLLDSSFGLFAAVAV